MRTLGILTTAVASALGLVALALGIASIPDLKRYLKMRSM
ncbi:MAG: hypothetical protein JWO63_2763 [Frankiales bacterium]|nr:hypothetical protein [Frankiales bacterium]